MSVQSEIDRINGAKNQIKMAIEDKGVSVPAGASLGDFASKIGEIKGDDIVLNSVIEGTVSEIENDSVKTIGLYAFYSNSNLSKAHFINAESVKDCAFYECTSLRDLSLPNVTYIGISAFRHVPISNLYLQKLTEIDEYGFYYCNSMLEASLPMVTSIAYNAFGLCTALATVSLPKLSTIGTSAFNSCRSLVSVSFPEAYSIGSTAFGYCTNLKTAKFDKVSRIYSTAFRSCTLLSYVYFLSSSVATLSNSNVFSGCTGLTSIYVPASLVNSYKTATNWTYYSDKIVGY